MPCHNGLVWIIYTKQRGVAIRDARCLLKIFLAWQKKFQTAWSARPSGRCKMIPMFTSLNFLPVQSSYFTLRILIHSLKEIKSLVREIGHSFVDCTNQVAQQDQTIRLLIASPLLISIRGDPRSNNWSWRARAAGRASQSLVTALYFISTCSLELTDRNFFICLSTSSWTLFLHHVGWPTDPASRFSWKGPLVSFYILSW